MLNPKQPEDLYRASKVNNRIKEYIKNSMIFPKELADMEVDLLRIVDNISSGRERAYLLELSSELSNIDNKTIVNLLGIAIEMQIIAAYVKDDILDGNYERNSQPTVNYQYNNNVAAIYSDLFLDISYLVLEELRPMLDEIYYHEYIVKIHESYRSICIGQIETTCFNYSAPNLISSICSLYERLVGVAYANYCSMLISKNRNLKEGLFRFGKYIGVALQVKNDISDFIIEPDISGIPVYQDLLQNQPNVVIAYLIESKENYSNEEIALLDELLSNNDRRNKLSEENEVVLQSMLEKSNAISKSIELLGTLLSNCLDCLCHIKNKKIKNEYTNFIKTLIYE